jgi:hypothetical protein
MPNWVSMDISIVGPKKDVESFISLARSSHNLEHAKLVNPSDELGTVMSKLNVISDDDGVVDLCSSSFIPHPSGDPKNLDCDWCREHWGSKWGFCDTELVRRTPRGVHYYADSPWGVPDRLFMAMSTKFPSLRISYHGYEGGMGFKVHGVLKGGKYILHKESNYTGHRGG